MPEPHSDHNHTLPLGTPQSQAPAVHTCFSATDPPRCPQLGNGGGESAVPSSSAPLPLVNRQAFSSWAWRTAAASRVTMGTLAGQPQHLCVPAEPPLSLPGEQVESPQQGCSVPIPSPHITLPPSHVPSFCCICAISSTVLPFLGPASPYINSMVPCSPCPLPAFFPHSADPIRAPCTNVRGGSAVPHH